jgi:hypothetical protein
VWLGPGFNGLEQGPVEEFCEHGYEPSGATGQQVS